MKECTASKSKLKKSTASPTTSKESTSSSNLKECTASRQSDKKDRAYEHMKSYLFKFLKTKIRFGADDLDLIQYEPFVKKHKNTFIRGYCKEFKITNKKFVKEWYIIIVSDEGNWPILLDAIEQQMELSDSLHIKLKEEMKNELISYANGKKRLETIKGFSQCNSTVKASNYEKVIFITRSFTFKGY